MGVRCQTEEDQQDLQIMSVNDLIVDKSFLFVYFQQIPLLLSVGKPRIGVFLCARGPSFVLTVTCLQISLDTHRTFQIRGCYLSAGLIWSGPYLIRSVPPPDISGWLTNLPLYFKINEFSFLLQRFLQQTEKTDVTLADFIYYVREHEKNLKLHFSHLDKNRDGKDFFIFFYFLSLSVDFARFNLCMYTSMCYPNHHDVSMVCLHDFFAEDIFGIFPIPIWNKDKKFLIEIYYYIILKQ